MIELLLRETLQFCKVHVKENRADCVVSVCDGNSAVTATRHIVAKMRFQLTEFRRVVSCQQP